MHFCHLVFPLGTVCLDLDGPCPFWGVGAPVLRPVVCFKVLLYFYMFLHMLLVALAPHGGGFVVEIAFSYT